MAAYNYIQDPGHGWIEVPMKEITRLGIAKNISECSYAKDGNAYLEEDCDAGVFLEAKKKAHEECEIEGVEVESTDIREYQRFVHTELYREAMRS